MSDSDGHTPEEPARLRDLEAAARAVAPKFLRLVEGLGEDEQRALALLFRSLAVDGEDGDDTAGHGGYVPYDLENPTDEGLNPGAGASLWFVYRSFVPASLAGWWQQQTMDTLRGSNAPKRLRGSR